MNRQKEAQITAFIICMNEESQIRRCLESVKWCDEIVMVVDSRSSDRTLDICKEYTSRIFVKDWPGFVKQKRFGLEQCTTEWVLNLDADEEVSDELRDEILDALVNSPQEVNGYYLSRVVFFLGRWWRKGGWYPEYRLRLCRRAFTQWGGNDPHEKAIVSGQTKRLSGELHHYTYSDLSHQVRTLNSFSSQAARTLYDRGKRATWFNVMFNPLFRFAKWYLLKKGFREGFPGLSIAILEAYYVFLKYLKLWELGHTDAREKNLTEKA